MIFSSILILSISKRQRCCYVIRISLIYVLNLLLHNLNGWVFLIDPCSLNLTCYLRIMMSIKHFPYKPWDFPKTFCFCPFIISCCFSSCWVKCLSNRFRVLFCWRLSIEELIRGRKVCLIMTFFISRQNRLKPCSRTSNISLHNGHFSNIVYHLRSRSLNSSVLLRSLIMSLIDCVQLSKPIIWNNVFRVPFVHSW